LADVLTYAAREIDLMQTEEALRLVTWDLFRQLQRDNMLYAEIRFAPMLHTEQGLSPKEVVSIVDHAVRAASQETGVEARLLLCTLRHYSETQSLATAKLVEQFQDTSVVGLDLAGDEAGFSVDAHIPAFQYAKAQGIPCTAHAGEACGSESVWETLQQLTPWRIGHGVGSIEDLGLLETLRQHEIHLEVCPSCNVYVDHRRFEAYSDHPVGALYDAGISISVNSDVRTLVPVQPNEQYEQLHQVFGWGKEQFLQCNLNALKAAFVPEPARAQLVERLLQGYQA
jgi:adenosine deaminase